MSVVIWEKRHFGATVPPHAVNGLLVVVTDNQGNAPRVQRVSGSPGVEVGFDVEAPPSAAVVVSIFGVDSNNQLGGAANYSYNSAAKPANSADPVNAATVGQNQTGWVLKY